MPRSPSRRTSKLVVPEPPEDGSRHVIVFPLVHAVVPHAILTPDTIAVGVGSIVPKLSPVIVTEVPPLAGPFVGM